MRTATRTGIRRPPPSCSARCSSLCCMAWASSARPYGFPCPYRQTPDRVRFNLELAIELHERINAFVDLGHEPNDFGAEFAPAVDFAAIDFDLTWTTPTFLEDFGPPRGFTSQDAVYSSRIARCGPPTPPGCSASKPDWVSTSGSGRSSSWSSSTKASRTAPRAGSGRTGTASPPSCRLASEITPTATRRARDRPAGTLRRGVSCPDCR